MIVLCKDCVFWSDLSSCHRWAPRPLHDQTDDYITSDDLPRERQHFVAWPATNHYDGCGEGQIRRLTVVKS